MSLLIFYCKDLVIGQLFIDYFFLVELNELVASLDARWEAHSRVLRVLQISNIKRATNIRVSYTVSLKI